MSTPAAVRRTATTRRARVASAPLGASSLSSSMSSEESVQSCAGSSIGKPSRLPQRHLPARTIRFIYVVLKHNMKWGSMASKCAGRGVPFGYDPQTDRFVWLSSVPLDRYGERCGLVCPSCGGKLQAVRTATNTPHPYYKCFRHSSLSSCGGGFEPQLHRAVKSLLADSVGREFRLPMVSFGGCRAARIEDKRFRAMGPRLAADFRTGRPLRLSGDLGAVLGEKMHHRGR